MVRLDRSAGMLRFQRFISGLMLQDKAEERESIMNWIELICLLVALVVPVLSIWRFGLMGILIGGILSWAFVVGVDVITTSPDPEVGPIRQYWLHYGWAVTLTYSSFLYFLKWAYGRIRSPAAVPPEGE